MSIHQTTSRNKGILDPLVDHCAQVGRVPTMDMSKVSRLIRIAYARPELRQKVLTAIWTAARKQDSGEYKPGAKVKNVKDLKVGDLLVVETKMFPGKKDLVRVTAVGGDGFSTLYVDPKDPSEKRRPSDRPIKFKAKQLEKGQFSRAKKAASLNVGNSLEDERRMLRFHRFRDSLRVWDLTNAGKRGKKVKIFAVTGLDRAGGAEAEFIFQVTKAPSFAAALKLAKEWVDTMQETTPFVHLYETEERGVDVTPAGFRPITVDGKHVYIQAEYNSFRIKDKVDLANEPTCIPAIKGGKKDIKVFYRWVKDNESKLKGMKFHDVLRAMMSEGIKYHQYCAMD